MRCMVIGANLQRGRAWLEAIEDQGEGWRCAFLPDASATAASGMEAVILMPGARRVLDELVRLRPPEPPYVICDAWQHPRADGSFPLAYVRAMTDRLAAWELASRLPGLCADVVPGYTCQARELLHCLGVRPRLRAMNFLPDMLALAAAHPALLQDMDGRLYALVARRHGLNAPQVERSLRLAVESTWNHAPLASLDGYFGQSVDPERGKPTNREFVARMAEHLLRDDDRVQQAL